MWEKFRVIFTIPALVIIGYWPDFEYGWVLTIAGPSGRRLSFPAGLAGDQGHRADLSRQQDGRHDAPQRRRHRGSQSEGELRHLV